METHTHITSTTIYLGMCETCNRPYRVDLGDQVTGITRNISCPGCNESLFVERLAAVFTEEVCDARCMGAAGPSCSCACGGANHGAAWGTSATTYELESAVAALRARQERLERQREQRAAAKQARKERVFVAWVAEGNQDVVDYLMNGSDFGDFIFAMYKIVARQEPLTERQADAVRRNITREAQRAAQQATYEASKKAAPLGKNRVVEGTIISIKAQAGYFANHGDTWKMTVECDGYRAYGSVPRSLIGNIITAGCYTALKGQRVRFVAELVPSKGDDPSFVYFKRPTQAQKI